MSHDKDNAACPQNWTTEHGDRIYAPCTCPPAVDEVEQIRADFEKWSEYGTGSAFNIVRTLLRNVDQLRAELAEERVEIERLRAGLRRYADHTDRCLRKLTPACVCGLDALVK